MTGKNTLARILMIATLSLGAIALAQAQPAPPGGGGANPGGTTTTPAPKPPYESPWNGQRDPNGREATEFGRLLDLYDAWQDAEAALQAAKRCHQNEAEWQRAVDAAKAAFNTALAVYIDGWSNFSYSGLKFAPGTGDVVPASQERMEKNEHYKDDRQKVFDALKRDDKKPHPVPDQCPLPPAPSPSGADIAPEHSSLPPCDDGDKVVMRISDDETALSQNVERQRTATGEALASLKAEEAAIRGELAGLSGLQACPSEYHPPPEEHGGGPSITIGIGVGVGTGGHHGHHDDHPRDRPHEDRPRD